MWFGSWRWDGDSGTTGGFAGGLRDVFTSWAKNCGSGIVRVPRWLECGRPGRKKETPEVQVTSHDAQRCELHIRTILDIFFWSVDLK